MNYFSKYVKKFQNGGDISQTSSPTIDQESFNEAITLFQTNPDAFLSAAEAAQDQEGYQLVNTLIDTLNNGDVESAQALLANRSNAQYLVELYQMIQESSQADKSSPASLKTGGKVEYLSYLKCGGVPDCGCGKKLRKKPVKAEDGTALPEKTWIFPEVLDKFMWPKNSNETPQTTGKIIYINENGVPFEDQSAAPGLHYTKPYGEVREDGYTTWRQNDPEAGPVALLKRPAEYRILRNGIYELGGY